MALLFPHWVRATGQTSEQTFAVLQTKTGMYTNVTVTKQTSEYIFIMHSTGVCNVKAIDLLPETRVTLGYDAVPSEKEESASSTSSSHSHVNLPHFNLSQIKELAADWQHNGKQKLAALTGSNPTILYGIVGIFGVVYLFVSTCFWLICRKTHNAPGPLVWVPILQLIPLLRAANMSRAWFFAYFIPVLNIIASIVWSVKIVKTRGKSPFVAFLLILPVTNFFAFLYLAFSRSAPVEMKKNELLVLETA